jgi:hypothetical protein
VGYAWNVGYDWCCNHYPSMLLSISELKYDHQNSNCLPYIIWRQSTTYVDHWRPITFDLRLYNVNSIEVICNYGDIHGISQDIFSLWWWFIDSHDNRFCCFLGSDWNWTERTGVFSKPIRAGHKSLLHSFGPFISGPIFGKLVPYSLHLMYSPLLFTWHLFVSEYHDLVGNW